MRARSATARLGELYLSPTSREYQARKVIMAFRRQHKGMTPSDLANPEEFKQNVERQLRIRSLNGQAQRWFEHAIGLIAEHVGDGGHADITERLLEAGEDKLSLDGLDAERLFKLTLAARSAGLFVGSGNFETAALAAFGARAQSLNGVRGLLQQARFALAIGDSEQANRYLQPLQRLRVGMLIPEVLATIRYLELATGRVPRADPSADGRERLFQDIIRNNTVLVYGPGPTDDSLGLDFRDVPVIRTLMPRVSWRSAKDFASSRIDVAYSNKETAQWLAGLDPDEFLRWTSHIACLRLKFAGSDEKRIRALHGGVGSVPHFPELISGTQNMIPIALWDVLLGGATDAHVIGATFWLVSHYRSDNPRSNTTTLPWERCRALAAHNPTANRRFVLNLTRSGRIMGDKNFLRALKLSDKNYLAELDKLYGAARK